MAYNESLGRRISMLMEVYGSDLIEKKMFGGIAFMYKGKMSVGVVKDDLMVRVVEEKEQAVLDNPAVRPMDFTGKPMKGFLYVSAEAFESDEELREWVELGVEHADRAFQKTKKK